VSEQLVQLLGIAAAFAVVVYLVSRQKPLFLAMLLASALVGLSWGAGPRELLDTLLSALQDETTISLCLSVAAITSLSALLEQLGLIDQMVASLRNLLQSPRLTIILIPGLIGCMPMTGGAIVSAPMVNVLGEEMGLTAEGKAAANIVFRHGWSFIFPFLPSMILVAQLSGLDVGTIIARQFPFTLVVIGAGYYFLVYRPAAHNRDCGEAASTGKDEAAATGTAQGKNSLPSRLGEFVRSAAPILVVILLFLGFDLHLALAALGGIAVTIFLARDRLRWKNLPLRLARSLDLKIVLSMMGIMVFRESIYRAEAFSALLSALVHAGVPLLLLSCVTPLFIGYASGSHSTTVAVTLPVVLPLALEQGLDPAGYVALVYGFSLLAYIVSPIHLCQILTNEYFGVSLTRVYRQYAGVFGALFAALVMAGLLLGT